MVLEDSKVHELIAAAYSRDSALGLLVDVVAGTGARPSQVVRLRIEDLSDHPIMPRLTLREAVGIEARSSQHYGVPITRALAAKLKAAAQGRAPDALLLIRNDGRP